MKALRGAGSLLQFLATPDPIMRKEMLGASRHWQTYFFRALYVGILGFVVWAIWLTETRHGSTTYSDLARMGRDLFTGFAWAQLVLVALGAVVLSSDMISKEVRLGTLGVALLTPLGPLRIVLGKWKASMGYLLLFVLSGLPILSTAVYMGGVAWERVGSVLAVTLATAALCVSLSLWVSTLVRSSYAGFVISVLLLFAYTFVPPLAVLVTVGPYRLDEYMWMLLLNPAFLMGEVLEEGKGGLGWLEPEWVMCGAFCAALSMAFVLMAARRTARLGLRTPSLPLLPRLLKALDLLFSRINPGGIIVGRRRTGPYDGNPLLWKELYFRATGRLRYFTRIALVLMLLAAIVMRASGTSILEPEFYLPAAALAGIFLLLSVIGAGSTTFTKEKEEGKWESLLATPLTAPQFVFAKLAGALVAASPALLLYLLSLVPLFAAAVLLGGARSTVDIVIFLFVTLLFVMFAILASSWFSLWCSTTRKAFGLSMSLVLFILAGFPILLGIAGALLDLRGGESIEFLFYSTNPCAYFELLDWREIRWDELYAKPAAGNYSVFGPPSVTRYAGFYTFLYLSACGGMLSALLIPFNAMARRNA